MNSIRTALLITVWMVLPIASMAQGGSLDLTFDNDGIVVTPLQISEDDQINSVAIQSNGKIVVAGYSDNGSNGLFSLVRYNPDGSLDITFGTNGIVTTDVGSNSIDGANSVLIQPDGKIVAAGSGRDGLGSPSSFALVRYNADGSLDNSFDNDGIVITVVATYFSEVNSVVLQADGKIVAGGSAAISGSYEEFALARYNSDGSLDNTFGTNGIVTTSIGVEDDRANAIVIQPDGKIVAAGLSYVYDAFDDIADIAVARYNTDGSLDNTFDTDGMVTTDTGLDDVAFSITLKSNGKIVVGGASRNVWEDLLFALVSYHTDGSLDNSFNTDGIVTTMVMNSEYTRILSIATQSDDKIVAAGFRSNGSDLDFALARYDVNGNLDNTFGTNGIVITPVGTSTDLVSSVAIQPDGQIVAAGSSKIGTDYEFAVARYNYTTVTGLTELDDMGTEANIYPNPFSAQAVLRTNYLVENATLFVYNSVGQTVMERRNISGNAIDFSRGNLSAGLYSLQLEQDNKITEKIQFIITD